MQAARHSERLYLLADKSKPGKVRPVLFVELSRFNVLVTNKCPTGAAFACASLTDP